MEKLLPSIHVEALATPWEGRAFLIFMPPLEVPGQTLLQSFLFAPLIQTVYILLSYCMAEAEFPFWRSQGSVIPDHPG